MCGIAGRLNLDGAPVDLPALDRMVLTLDHRGPDERATFARGPVGLGHTRLSIIDLAGGSQPMSNEDGSLWITFNGEIFNYVELRRELIAKGHRFASSSDTEVLLHLYEDHGPECVRFLNGQWAFAIWDDARRALFLSRDRFGVRPLFYGTAANTFVFASEIKGLLADRRMPREIDPIGVDQVFTFWAPRAPRTTFAGILELPPGHSLLVTDRVQRPDCYWRPGFAEGEVTDEAAAAEQLLELLVDATRLRLRSDVPVGAYLSGGLDSTAVTAMIRRVTSAPLRTFSIAFDQAELDESVYQREASAHLNTDHETVTCTARDIAGAFPEVIRHTETPILRTAPAPLFLLSCRVRELGYKVVLTGEGADEIFGGYDIFKEDKIRRFCTRFPESARRTALLRRLYPYMPNVQAQSAAFLRAFFDGTGRDSTDPFYSHLPRWGSTSRLKTFFSPQLRDRLAGYDAIAELRTALPPEYATWNPLMRGQYLETAILLPGYILSSQGDRMAMGHSVEGRFPFLDHRVAEFAARLPARLKMKGLQEKYLLKRAVRDLVPETIRRRRKQPYRAPDASSFFDERGRAPDYVDELLSESGVRRHGLFQPAMVSSLLGKARSGRVLGTRDNMALVGVLSTQLLAEAFIKHDTYRDTGTRRADIRRREFSVWASGHAAVQ